MYPRQARVTLERLAWGFPVLALTGPRQSGKTTLARACFSNKPYVSLENPDERDFAEHDPKRFLARFPEGAILDEVQRCPGLLSLLQGLVDERPVMGQFVLAGSAQFDLIAGMNQSLAGRIGRVELLPLSLAEMQAVEIKSGSTFASDWTGGLNKWQKFTGDTLTLKPVLIYGGVDSHEREHCFLTGWQDVASR
jgi:predicted AAA+ superfamily ATPase